MSDFCIEACLTKEDITKIVTELADKTATSKANGLVDYLSYWASAGFKLEKKASNMNNMYDLRSGDRVYSKPVLKDEPSLRQVMSTTLPPEFSKSLETNTPYHSSVREAFKNEVDYTRNSAKESIEAYLEIISADQKYINKIVSDDKKYAHFRTEMLDREDVNDLELSELKELFAKYLRFLDIDLEKSGFYDFSNMKR